MFTFANDPGDGTFAFNTLGAFSMSYSFPGINAGFTQADIVSDLNQVFVTLSTVGPERLLRFDDDGGGNGGGGTFSGSLDLINGSAFLSFSPTAVPGPRYVAGDDVGPAPPDSSQADYVGDYRAASAIGNGVPEGGSTIALMLSAIGTVGALRRKLGATRLR